MALPEAISTAGGSSKKSRPVASIPWHHHLPLQREHVLLRSAAADREARHGDVESARHLKAARLKLDHICRQVSRSGSHLARDRIWVAPARRRKRGRKRKSKSTRAVSHPGALDSPH